MSNATDTLDKALEILTKEVDKLHQQSLLPTPLTHKDAACLTDYVKTLIIVRKDERDAAKADNLPSKSDDELFELAKQAAEFLEGMKPQPAEEKKDDKPADGPSPPKKDEAGGPQLPQVVVAQELSPKPVG